MPAQLAPPQTEEVVSTDVQLKFLDVPVPFDSGLWKISLKEVVRTHADMQWQLGDLLIEGKDFGKMPDKTLKMEAERATKLDWGTLKNYMVTARAIPPSRRRDGTGGRPMLSYSVHVEVTKFDEEKQEELLEYAAKQNFSVRQVKVLIAAKQERRELPKVVKTPKALEEETGPSVLQRSCNVPVKLTRLHYDFLKSVWAARAEGKSYYRVEEFVHLVVCEWVTKNIDSLMEDAKKSNPKWANLKPEYREVLRNTPYDWRLIGERRLPDPGVIRKLEEKQKRKRDEDYAAELEAMPEEERRKALEAMAQMGEDLE